MPQPSLLKRPLTSAAALLLAGGLVLGGLVLARSSRAAAGPQLPPLPNTLVSPDPSTPNPAVTAPPIAVQALDATHFVVVTREPLLCSKAGEDGRYYNLVLN